MTTHQYLLWTLAAGTFPVLSSQDKAAVHDAYGPAFGPWRDEHVVDSTGRPLVGLALGGNTDLLKALRAAAKDWRTLTQDQPGHALLVHECPEHPTIADVALNAPHGLLVLHGVVRLFGPTNGDGIDGDLTLLTD